MKSPHIRTPLPGPKAEVDAQALRRRSSRRPIRATIRSSCRTARAPKCGTSTAIVSSTSWPALRFARPGHSHPQVVQAIKDAADKFLHISSDYWHEGQIALSEKMNALSPMREPTLSFFCQSGTESVEGALKLARYVTGRGRFIGFLGGFHGRTMGSLAFTSSKYTQQKGFFPTMPGVTHVPYPNNYRPLLRG